MTGTTRKMIYYNTKIFIVSVNNFNRYKNGCLFLVAVVLSSRYKK
jgi:hypothetical protein